MVFLRLEILERDHDVVIFVLISYFHLAFSEIKSIPNSFVFQWRLFMHPHVKNLVIAGLIAASLLFLLNAPGFAQTISYTNPGYVACYERNDLQDIQEFGAQINREALIDKIGNNQCFVLTANIPVYLIEVSWSHVRISPLGSGEEMWTVRDAIFYDY